MSSTEKEEKPPTTNIPTEKRIHSDFKQFAIEFGKRIGKIIFFVLTGSHFLYIMHEKFGSLRQNFPVSPYDINPDDYITSAFGMTKRTESQDIGRAIMNYIMKWFRYMGTIIQSIFGINITQVTSAVDVRYENPFTLANIYSWATVNETIMKLLKKVQTGIKATEGANKAVKTIITNIIFYFATTLFMSSIMIFGALSVFGMVKGIMKNIYTKVPGYGTLYLIIYLVLLVLSLVVFPFSPGLYVIAIQFGVYFYNLFLKNTLSGLFAPGKMSENIGFIKKYMWKGKYAILIYACVALYNASFTSLNKKHQDMLVTGIIRLAFVLLTRFLGKIIMKNMNKDPNEKEDPDAEV
jgi:hypothetical protein